MITYIFLIILQTEHIPYCSSANIMIKLPYFLY